MDPTITKKTSRRVEQAKTLSERARKLVPESDQYPKGGSHQRGDILAHYSLVQPKAPTGSLQELVGKLKEGEIPIQAKELLGILKRQYDVDPECAVRLLLALNLETKAAVLLHEENAERYLGLARAIQEVASLQDITGSVLTTTGAVLPEVTTEQFLQWTREGHESMLGIKQRLQEKLANVPEGDDWERKQILTNLENVNGIIAQFEEILGIKQDGE